MLATAEKIWAAAQEHLKKMLTGDTYTLWFAPLRACGLDQTSLTLEVGNDFCEVWIKDNYQELLEDVLAMASGQKLQLKLCVAAQTAPAPAVVQPAQKPRPAEPIDRTASLPVEQSFNPKNTFESFVVGSNNQFS